MFLSAAAGKFGKHLPEAGHVQGDAAPGDDEGDGYQDHHYAQSLTGRHPFSEDGNAEKYGCHRLQGTQDGSGCGAYILYRAGGAEEGYGLVVQRKDMAVGKMESARMLAHMYQWEGVVSSTPVSSRIMNSDTPKTST